MDVLDLFFELREAAAAGLRVLGFVPFVPFMPFAPFTAPICGLCLLGREVCGLENTGDGSGWNLGDLATVEFMVGVTCPSDMVSRRLGCGFLELAASGSRKPSIPGSSTSISEPPCAPWATWGDCGNLISEAGVAGEPRTRACARLPALCDRVEGDLPAEFSIGRGGGAMSDKCSGEIEPFSESSVLAVDRDELVPFERSSWGFDGSSMSPKVWGGIAVLEIFFPLLGFTIGDCLTLRALGRCCFWADFLLCFLCGNEPFAPERVSRLVSIGELVVSECRWSYTEVCSFCACKAGELKGLKYAPGTVYSGIVKCASSGVTAGETSGVKAISCCSFTCIRYRSNIACCWGSD